jgi:hypothetical protein
MSDILKAVVGPLLQILADIFGGAGQDGLRQAMATLFSVPSPDFSVAWFKTLYSPAFAFGLLLGLVVAVIVTFRHKYETGGTLGGAVNGLLYTPKVYIQLLLLPVALALGVFVSGILSSAVMTVFGAKDSSSIESLLSIVGSNPIDSLGFSALVWIVSHVLAIEVWVIANSLFLAAFAGTVVIPSRGLAKFTEGLFETYIGFIVVALGTKPMMLLVLLPGRALSQNTVGGSGAINLVTLYLAAFVPFFLFWMYHKNMAQIVGGRVNVDGSVSDRSRGMTRTAIAAGSATAGTVVAMREIYNDSANEAGETSKARTAGMMAKSIADGAAVTAVAAGQPEVAAVLKVASIGLGHISKPPASTPQPTAVVYEMSAASGEEGSNNGGHPDAHTTQQA